MYILLKKSYDLPQIIVQEEECQNSLISINSISYSTINKHKTLTRKLFPQYMKFDQNNISLPLLDPHPLSLQLSKRE